MNLRDGLPYGWWKSPDVWAASLCGLAFLAVMTLLFLGWFFDIKAWW